MAVSITHSTPADGSFSSTGATAWNTTHAIGGLINSSVVFGSSGTFGQSSKFTYDDDQNRITIGLSGAFPNAGRIVGASETSSTGNGADLIIAAGSVAGNGTAGSLNFSGGDASFSSSSIAGSVNINGGSGLNSVGTAAIQAGFITEGAGGNVFVAAGPAGGVGNYDGGSLFLNAGDPAGSGNVGRIRIGLTFGSTTYALPNSTNAVLVTNVGPIGLTSSTINHWLPLVVDGQSYFIPLWK